MVVSLPFYITIQASNEAETRTKKFDDLYEDLEDFYNTVEELDQWMDTAIEKGHSIKVSEQDPELQYELFQVSSFVFFLFYFYIKCANFFSF